MTAHKYFENANQQVILIGLVPMLLAIAAVPLTYNLVGDQQIWPYLLSAESSKISLALLFTRSASLIGSVLIGLLVLVLFLTRRRLSSSYRVGEALIIAVVAILFAGGGAFLNEHVVKEKLKFSRPNIEWLTSSAGGGAIATSPEQFYQSGNIGARADALRLALGSADVPVPEPIQEHWISETGYSFPSGHTYAAFFLATFFIFMGATFIESRRKYILYLLAPWAVGVAYSRVALMVHTPIDVSVGALDGIVTGIIAWLIARFLIRILANSSVIE